jgi:hypothetical protein
LDVRLAGGVFEGVEGGAVTSSGGGVRDGVDALIHQLLTVNLDLLQLVVVGLLVALQKKKK